MIDQKNYIQAEKEISLLNLNIDKIDKIEDEAIFDIILSSRKILKKYFKKKISLNSTQIPRGGKESLNCGRHMKIFEKFEIIPEFCFGCYKVEIEPKNVIDLIKLHFLFDGLKFNNENLRKCMIEGRKNVSGNYKGFVYCKSLGEANDILLKLSTEIKNKIDDETNCKIKRGCSEYALSFPQYKNLNSNLMEYNSAWKKIENDFDKEFNFNKVPDLIKLTWGLTIKDILIFNNWIIFAKSIGDRSYKKIYE